MKKYIIIPIFLCATVLLQAQFPVWTFYHSQSRGEGIQKFTVPGLLVKAGSWFIPADEPEVKALLKKMGTVRMLITEGQTNAFSENEARRFVKRLRRYNYEDLIAVKDGKERVNIMVKTRKGKVRRYLLFVNDENDSVLIAGKCKLRVEDFTKLINENQSKITPKNKNINFSEFSYKLDF